jgi:hypothetical protein
VRVFDPKEASDVVFEKAESDQHRIGVDKIRDAIGLYVIGMRPRGKLVPFYVGKAVRQTLHTRLFQKKDKLAKVQDIINEYVHVKPFVFLFPLVTPLGSLARRVAADGSSDNSKRIDTAEYMMIGHAMNVNPWLHNIQTVVSRENFSIDGSPGAYGPDTAFARGYREMMNFTRPSKAAEKMKKVSDQTQAEDEATLAEMKEALSHPESLKLEPDREEEEGKGE